jgi:hypothetical protein
MLVDMRRHVHITGNIRNTGRVERSLVNVVGKHCDRVSIVFWSCVMI